MENTLLILQFLLILIISLIKCEDSNENPVVFQPCDRNNRPQECTFLYLPVCGFAENCSVKTYGNACFACLDNQVYGYQDGECTQNQTNDFPSDVPQTKKCEDSDRNIPCTEEFLGDGFCGHFDGEGEVVYHIYGTPCQACSDPRVIFWVKGKCENQDFGGN